MADNATVWAAHDVEITFPGVKALKGVDIELKPGQVHALVGKMGAENRP